MSKFSDDLEKELSVVSGLIIGLNHDKHTMPEHVCESIKGVLKSHKKYLESKLRDRKDFDEQQIQSNN